MHWVLFFVFFYVTHVGTEFQCEAISGVTHVSWVFGIGKPCRNTCSYSLESKDNSYELLGYLLDVNSGPCKHIHKLRVLSALLITMPETEISIVSPSVHFS